ncbi:MAG: acyltransferase [Lachnospiraceae bacterium]|nr:acyltransferase [Lachnospiraceae bacterium]
MALTNNKSKRNANIELLRIISMIMVTMLHALDKGGLLVNIVDNPGVNTWVAWGLEALSISAVNIFMLISGYFLIDSKFKLSRFFELIGQTIFYTLGAFIVCYALGINKGETDVYWMLNYILPIHMKVFWFITSYVVLYALLPIITEGVHRITQKQLGTMLIILLVYECAFKSFLPFRMYTDEHGYSFIWYLIVFLVGAYLKLYGFKILNTPAKGLLLYFVSCLFILAEHFTIGYIIKNFGHLEELAGLAYEYNNFFVLTAALGIFAAFVHFKDMKEAPGKVVCFLSPMALGVYLFQENQTLRYRWQPWFKLQGSLQSPLYVLLGKVLLAVICMYLIGTAVDYLRILLFNGIKKAASKKS